MSLQDDDTVRRAPSVDGWPPRGVCPLRWAQMSRAAKRRILGERPVFAAEPAADLAPVVTVPLIEDGLSDLERQVLRAVRALKRSGCVASAPRIAEKLERSISTALKSQIRQALKALRRHGLVELRFSPEGRLMDAEELVA